MIVTTTAERLFGQGHCDDLEHTRQALARFEAIDSPDSPSRNAQPRPDGAQPARRARRRAIQRLGNAGNAVRGIHLGYASLAFDSPFRNKKDYADYVSRLHQISRVLDQAMDTCATECATTSFRDVSARKSVESGAGIATTRWTRVHSQNRCASFPIPSLSRSASNCERRSKPSEERVAPPTPSSPNSSAKITLRTAASIPASGLARRRSSLSLRHPSSDDHRFHRRPNS